MRPPTLKVGCWKVRYRQIPYTDRYYFVDIIDSTRRINENVMKFSSSLGFHYRDQLFSFLEDSFATDERKWKVMGDFFKRVEKYNNWIDADPFHRPRKNAKE